MAELNKEQLAFIQELMDEYEDDSMPCDEWEGKFMDDHYKRFEQYGEDMRISSKQWTILKRIGQYYNLELKE